MIRGPVKLKLFCRRQPVNLVHTSIFNTSEIYINKHCCPTTDTFSTIMSDNHIMQTNKSAISVVQTTDDELRTQN